MIPFGTQVFMSKIEHLQEDMWLMEKRREITEHENDYFKRHYTQQWDAAIEATEDLYQERLEKITSAQFKQMTLAQVEAIRFMTREQYSAFWRRNIK